MQLLISQPEEWIEAFKAQANRQGLTLSEWIGACCLEQLPAKVRKALPQRPPAHRPKKNSLPATATSRRKAKH